MLSNFVAVADGFSDEIFPNLHRVRQIVTERERGADGGGISAAGSVRGNTFDERGREQQFRFAVEENVNRLAAIFQVAALEQNGAAEFGVNLPGGLPHLFGRGNFLASEDFGFVQVRGDERGEREQFFFQDFFRRRLQQPCAASGDHHRVNDQRNLRTSRPRSEKFCDDGNIFRREQHSRLHRRWFQFGKHGFNLLLQHSWRARFDAEDAPGILRGEAGDGAGAVDAERGEGLQIRLHARAAAAVGTGDGEGEGKVLADGSHGGKFSRKAPSTKLQHPEKLQSRKLQSAHVRFGVCSLEVHWSLDVGAWSFLPWRRKTK